MCIELRPCIIQDTIKLRMGTGSTGWVDVLHGMVQLRAQREKVEELVDDVVQTYHSGFNKAIHNYSRILHLFSESKELVTCPRQAPRTCMPCCTSGMREPASRPACMLT